MKKEFKIVKGEYRDEKEVVIEVVTEETVVQTTSTVFNVGVLKKELQLLIDDIESKTKRKDEILALLDSTKAIAQKAVIKEDKKEEKKVEVEKNTHE